MINKQEYLPMFFGFLGVVSTAICIPILAVLHPAPCTLHPAPCTLHPASGTLNTGNRCVSTLIHVWSVLFPTMFHQWQLKVYPI